MKTRRERNTLFLLPMFKHWLLHMGRVQVMAIVLSVVIFLLAIRTGANSDVASLELREAAQVTVMVNRQKYTFVSTLANQSHQVLLRVPAFSQLPELHNGCEVTSLSMLLSDTGKYVPKTTLATAIQKDTTPLTLNRNGQIARWGNPDYGFVGSVSGNAPGYGVYHRPIAELLNKIEPGQALDLTGSSFEKVLSMVASGRPVIVWTTLDFAPVKSWVTWQSPEGMVRATMYEHTVLLVGFDKTHLFVNNPLTGIQAESVPIGPFRESWIQMGRQAVTVKNKKV